MNKPKRYRRQYTPEEDEYIRNHYKTTRAEDVGKVLGRDAKSVNSRAEKLGVKKDPEFRKWQMRNWGAKTRFTKGHKSNLGPKPRDIVIDIGEIRKARGFSYIRVSKEHRNHKDWEMLHYKIWKEHNGEIPANCLVTFKDGNKDNVDISNLVMMDRGDFIRGKICKYPEEIRKLDDLIRRFNKTIGAMKNGK